MGADRIGAQERELGPIRRVAMKILYTVVRTCEHLGKGGGLSAEALNTSSPHSARVPILLAMSQLWPGARAIPAQRQVLGELNGGQNWSTKRNIGALR